MATWLKKRENRLDLRLFAQKNLVNNQIVCYNAVVCIINKKFQNIVTMVFVFLEMEVSNECAIIGQNKKNQQISAQQ